MKTRTALAPLIVIIALATGMAPSAMGGEGLYIDITAAPRKLPIAIMQFHGPYGKSLNDIITRDLSYSGVFEPMDKGAFAESPTDDFDPGNWVGTGAEAVVKGEVESLAELVVTIRLYDVVESRLIMEKKYRGSRTLIRPLAHAAANDIYEKITGKKAVFRSKIAYVTREGEDFGLNVSDWDGFRPRKLGVTARALLSPHWTPQGRGIVYSAERGRKWGIYKLDFAAMKEEPLLVLKGTTMAGGFFPGGKRLAISSSIKGTSDIYSYDMAKKKLKRLTRGMGIEVSPSVSPDGKWIAYVSDRGGSPQIYTMDNMGYNKLRLTYEGSYNTSPSWSPRGDMLVLCGLKGGRNQIFTVWPDGTGMKMLTASGNNEEPSFSPDGRFITFTSDRDGYRAVYVMSADGSGQRRITPRGAEAFSPMWSPR